MNNGSNIAFTIFLRIHYLWIALEQKQYFHFGKNIYALVDSTDEVINELWTFINVRREEFQKSCSVCCPCPLVHSQKNQTIYYPTENHLYILLKGKRG